MDEGELVKRLEEIEQRLSRLEGPNAPAEVVGDEGNIFDVDGEKITLTRAIGDNVKSKTQNISLLVLLGHKQKFGQDKVHPSILKENVAIHEVPLENFPTHLKGLIPQSVLRVGKARSNKACYKLTTFGEARARRLLREVLGNEAGSGS